MINKIIPIIFFTVLLKAQVSVYIFYPVEIVAARPVNNFHSMDVIHADDLRNVKSLSLEESFTGIPGIIINDRNNPSLGDKISIRGIGTRSSFGVRGIKIIADNIPLTFPDGQSQTNNIDLYSTGRIEILKGPSSTFYGNSAGGLINYSSQIPRAGVFNIDPEITAGSFEFQKYSLKLSGNYYPNTYLINFNSLYYKGLRLHSSRKSYQLNSVYTTMFSDNLSLKLTANLFNSPYLLNPGSLDKPAVDKDRNSVREFNKQQGTGEKTDQFQAGVTVYFDQNNFSLESTVYFIKRNVLNPIPGRIIDLKKMSGGLRSAVVKKFVSENYTLNINAGADIEFQNDLRKEFGNPGLDNPNLKPEEIFDNLKYGNKLLDQKENVSVIAPFFAVQLLIGKNLGLLSGIRYDNYLFEADDHFTNNSGERYMNSLSPSAGIFYKPSFYSKIYLNYSTSFQTPTASELSNRPDAEGGFNPALNPENIYQFELGSNYLLNELNTSVSAAVYYLNFKDLIVPYQVLNSEETYFRNAGKADNKGAEIFIESSISQKLKTVLSYSVMDFKFKDYIVQRDDNYYQLKGNRVPGIPMQTFYMQLKFEEEPGISAGINFSLNDEYFTNDFNGAPPGSFSPQINYINKSYIKIDLRLAYNFYFDKADIIIFSGINNLFDKKYNGSVVPNAAGERYFEPAPGRNWYAGLRVEY